MRAGRVAATALALAGALLLAAPAGADPPAVSITGGPSGAVASTSATFDFSVDDPLALAECSLDGGGFSLCGSGVSYSGLGDGSHTFTVRATNLLLETGSDSRSWSVDTTGPSLTLDDIVVNVDDVSSAVVTLSASGSDPNGPVSMTCNPASGSTFSLGTTPVSCTGTDGLGNSSSGSFTVTVRDQTPPIVTTSGGSSVSVNGVTSAKVTFSASSNAGTPSCVPASGSSFSLGTTTVTCSATDSSGNTGTASFSITVQDTTPPTLKLPGTQTVSSNGASTAKVSYTVTASDGSRSIDSSCSPASGTSFDVGTTTVSCRATDAGGNTANGSFKVVVLGKSLTPPSAADHDAPADVTRLRAVAGDHTVTLSWELPTANDLAAIEVRMGNADGEGPGRVVSRTLRTSVTLRGLRNSVAHRFVVVSIDRAKNESRGAVVVAKPEAKRLVSPPPGTKVRTPPLLRWAPRPNASYYNVQLFRGKTKVFSAWPTRTRLQLSRTWVYGKTRRKLTPGTYTWYVWPGFGLRALVTYGDLIGKSKFIVLPPNSNND